MDYIHRYLENWLQEALKGPRKVVVLLGARQTGKTTLWKQVLSRWPGRWMDLNGDFLDDQTRLRPDRAALTELVRGLDLLVVDEAQNIPEVGRSLKLLQDEYAPLRVLATGSSSFDLRGVTGEPLTGRQVTATLHPLSYQERVPPITQRETLLREMLVYGGYPEVVSLGSPAEKTRALKQLASDYLLRDLFRQTGAEARRLHELLRLLAWQVGQEVSLSELGRQVHCDVKTIDRYLTLLEESFVIFRRGGFSRNLRKEVAKSRKIYFWDTGIRNAIVDAFQPVEQRSDAGQLWENLVLAERSKRLAAERREVRSYFWRTYDRQEIDLIEEESGELRAFECKWQHRDSYRVPLAWRENYPGVPVNQITPASAPGFWAASPSDPGRAGGSAADPHGDRPSTRLGPSHPNLDRSGP